MAINTDKFDVLCPLCKQPMVEEGSVFSVHFACENPKCKGYLRWTPHFIKTFFGNIELKDKLETKARN